MSLTTAVPLVLKDPGFLFLAPLLSTEPTHAALASTYDLDAWPVAWIPLGATEDGSEFAYKIDVQPIEVAEFFDPIAYSTVGRSGTFAFALANYTLTNLQRAWNGGTLSTVSGSGATLSSKLLPPSPGAETRKMLGWESLDHTVRKVMYQCLNMGEVKSSFKKAPAKATIPFMFAFEVPTGAPQQPFADYSAGTARLGT